MSNAAVTNAKAIQRYEKSVKKRFFYSQIRVPMRRRKDPPPGPTGRRCRLCRPKTCQLGVRSKRVTSHPVASDRRDIRTTARPPDQGGRGFLLLVIVISNPDEPAALRRLAALCRQRLCGGQPPVVFSRPPCLRLSGWCGFAPPRCWCTAHTEQHRPPAGPPPQGSPYLVPVTHTLCTGQHLLSAVEPKTSQ